MLYEVITEGLCSLKAGELRPAISILIQLSPMAEIMNYEIFQSLIKVEQQLTYYDVNVYADEDRNVRILRDIAEKFRKKRLDDGAIQITVPEISIWLNDNRQVSIRITSYNVCYTKLLRNSLMLSV